MKNPGFIDGVLIEGTDYSGKTTLCHNLAEALAEVNYSCQYGKDYITPTKLSKGIVKLGEKLPFGPEQDLAFTLATLAEICQEDCEKGTFYIQDRHWLSILAHNEFFYPGQNQVVNRMLREVHRPFRKNIYLTFDLDTKIKRFQDEPPTSSFDKYLAANPEVHEHYDQFWKGLIPEDENWLVIDTSQNNIKETTQRALEFILNENQ